MNVCYIVKNDNVKQFQVHLAHEDYGKLSDSLKIWNLPQNTLNVEIQILYLECQWKPHTSIIFSDWIIIEIL